MHRKHLITLITCNNQLSDTSPHSMLPNSGRVARKILLAPSGWKHRGKETVPATSFGNQHDYFVRPSCPCLWTRHTTLSIHNGRSLVTEELQQKITTIPIFQTTTHSRLKDVTDKCQNSAQGPAVETQRTMHVWDIHRLSETYAASSLLKQLVIEYVYRRRVRVRPL